MLGTSLSHNDRVSGPNERAKGGKFTDTFKGHEFTGLELFERHRPDDQSGFRLSNISLLKGRAAFRIRLSKRRVRGIGREDNRRVSDDSWQGNLNVDG